MARFRAVPYAKALNQVVRAECPERAEEVAAELDLLAAAVAQVPALVRVMVTPTVVPERKQEILDQVLDHLGVGGPTRRLAHVVQRHYRLEQVGDIAAAYRELVDRASGRTRTRVETVGALAPKQRKALVATLEGLVGGEVVAQFVDNPSLIAGFRVQVGSKVFDGSVAGQLAQLTRATARR